VKRRDDPKQALIDWGNPQTPIVVAAASYLDAIKLAADAPPPLIQRLPWDFTTTFPQPTDEAIDAGVLDESDRELDNLRSLHENYSRQCLATLKALDTAMDARRKGLDPGTGKPPRTHAARERLRKYLAEEPVRLEHAFQVLIETYENAFGVEAAAAFAKCIQARHAGIPVEADAKSKPAARQASDTQPTDDARQSKTMRTHRSPTVLPAPKPLPEAITAGHFGEENGKPVNPTPAEVRAITENHAEKIIDLLEGLKEVERSLASPQCSEVGRLGSECNRLKKQVKSAVEKYAASFGQEAAEKLEAYVRRQALTRDAPARSR
jgi:hypothetical protein